ncbi:MAG: DUF1543 domain-containing protein [Parvularculaceae bacterium]|nr:DUF1543 domain-containing protein [Parvularculaceae bacterium]
MKLFAVVVGGEVEGCHVELHDTRFVAGERIEDCYDALKAQWWGTRQSLHLDAWGPLDWADGYRIEVARAEDGADNLQRLWHLNLGGYDPARFEELHHNLFLVAPDWRSAKTRALAEVKNWVSPHKDYAIDVERAIDVESALGEGWRVKLTPSAEPAPFLFEARYVPIGKLK